ncbi:MAG: hypothetical protein NVS1B14_07860 [Vulcanimicrobiaceae bacterium]
MIIYAATKGFVNDVPTDRLAEWAKGLVDFLHAKYPKIGEGIAQSKQLSDEGSKALEAALAEFNKSF